MFCEQVASGKLGAVEKNSAYDKKTYLFLEKRVQRSKALALGSSSLPAIRWMQLETLFYFYKRYAATRPQL